MFHKLSLFLIGTTFQVQPRRMWFPPLMSIWKREMPSFFKPPYCGTQFTSDFLSPNTYTGIRAAMLFRSFVSNVYNYLSGWSLPETIKKQVKRTHCQRLFTREYWVCPLITEQRLLASISVSDLKISVKNRLVSSKKNMRVRPEALVAFFLQSPVRPLMSSQLFQINLRYIFERSLTFYTP